MAYGDRLQRGTGESSALIKEDVANEIIKGATSKSAALQLMRHVRMGTRQQRLPVISVLPTAYWITGATEDERDIGLKQSTKVKWENKYLDAEEIAVIVPIPEALIDDAGYPIWEEARPLVEEAVAIALDEAVFFGVNKPSSWPDAIVVAAAAAGNVVTAGTSTIDVADDINSVMMAVEADGYEVNGFWARIQMKGRLRGLRDANNNFIYMPDAGLGGVRNVGTIFGERAIFSRAGLSGFSTSASNYSLIAGDWNEAILGIRQDLTIKKFTEGVIQDQSGNIILNLMQQDSIAFRLTARFAFQVPNPINRQQQTAGSRYPFGALKQLASTGGE